MTNCAIVGINWGDEGKGRMVDLLTEDYDVVIRFQGGGNAGHTVINEKGKFALHLLPSGIFRNGVVNILGNGVALDPENLWTEIQEIMAKGVEITPDNLKISDRASLLLPWHRDMDELEEMRLADKKYGSTKQGIAPFYSDKYQKKTVLAGELLYPEELKNHLSDLMYWKNLTLTKVYDAKPYTMEMLEEWLETFCEKIKPYICDTGTYLKEAQASGKRLLFVHVREPANQTEPEETVFVEEAVGIVVHNDQKSALDVIGAVAQDLQVNETEIASADEIERTVVERLLANPIHKGQTVIVFIDKGDKVAFASSGSTTMLIDQRIPGVEIIPLFKAFESCVSQLGSCGFGIRIAENNHRERTLGSRKEDLRIQPHAIRHANQIILRNVGFVRVHL